MIRRMLARLFVPRPQHTPMRVTRVSTPREKERARQELRDVDAEIRALGLRR